MNNSISTKELIIIFDKLWATVHDIQIIGCVGRNQAYQIRNEIRKEMLKDGKIFTRFLVLTEYVIRYFGIDEQKIREKAMLGGIKNAE